MVFAMTLLLINCQSEFSTRTVAQPRINAGEMES